MTPLAVQAGQGTHDTHPQRMTDDTPSYDAWARQWLEGQQQAWQAWLGGAAAAPAVDPAHALGAWLGGEQAALGGALGARLVAQGQQFLQLAEALGEGLTAQVQAGEPPDWQALFDTTVARVRAALAPDADGPAHPAGALGGLFEEWQKVAARSGLPPLPGVPPEATPVLTAYAAALQAYGACLAQVQHDALDRLQRELTDQHAAGGSITSLRALYDLWVDASEAAYAERATTPAFVAAQADLAHALCRLHRAGLAGGTGGATATSPKGGADG